MPCFAEKKVPGFYQKPETTLKSNTNNTTRKAPLAIENPLKKGYVLKDLGKIILMKQIAERTCPSCKEPTFYDLGDYDACPCGKTTKPQLFSEMSPEEVLNNLEEVPF